MSERSWLTQLIEDPDGSPSSTRVAGVALTVTACAIAVLAVCLDRDLAGAGALVGALTGGGALAFFSRKRSSDVPAGAPPA